MRGPEFQEFGRIFVTLEELFCLSHACAREEIRAIDTVSKRYSIVRAVNWLVIFLPGLIYREKMERRTKRSSGPSYL